MKKAMEELKTKRLAKKIAGVTLGAFALGMVGAVPVYAADELSGGTFDPVSVAYIGGAPKHEVVIGGASGNASLITDMIIAGMVSVADNATITGSVVTASDVTSDVSIREIIGGYGVGANIVGDGNKVKLTNFKIKDTENISQIVGFAARPIGQMEKIEAKSTEVELTGLSNVQEIIGVAVLEELAKEVKAEKTTVTLNNVVSHSTVVGAILRAQSSTTSIGATVDITGGSSEGVTGARLKAIDFNGTAYVGGTVTAETTKVLLNNTTVEGDIDGVLIEDADIAEVSGTEIDIKKSTVQSVYGVRRDYQFSLNNAKKIDGTKLTLNGTEADFVTGVDIFAMENATAENTTVDITGGKSEDIIGALLGAADPTGPATVGGTVTADKTKVLLNKTTVENAKLGSGGDVTGVLINVADTAKVSGTEVEITGSTVEGVAGVDVEDNNSLLKKATIDDTKITLNGAKTAEVVGVVIVGDPNTVDATATKTQIILKGASNEINGIICGNLLRDDLQPARYKIKGADAELKIENIGNTAQNIEFFDKVTFVLPEDVKDGDIMLKLTEPDAPTDLSTADIKTEVIDAQYTKIDDGTKIYLINKTGEGELQLKDGKAPSDEVTIVVNAVTTKTGTYELGAKTDDKDNKKNDLWLNFAVETKPEPTPEEPDIIDNSKSLAETIAASLAQLNSGADFINDVALDKAKLVSKEGEKEGAMLPFVAFGGRSMKYKSGSHIDAKGWNAALGFAREQGELLYGIAVEHGQANYDSYVNTAHGEGKNKYTGGVIFGEIKKASGAHFDASFRAGRAKSDYNATLHIHSKGHTIATPTSYDTSSTYLGFSLGAGKELKVSEAGTLDLYARYYFNHLNGKNTKTNGVNPIDLEFKDSDSSRLRLGTRYIHQMGEKNKLYAGLAWQYEFAGKAKAVIHGIDVDAPSLKGHSAMAELGIKAEASKNFSIDLGVNGWLGKQRGVAGDVVFKWSF